MTTFAPADTAGSQAAVIALGICDGEREPACEALAQPAADSRTRAARFPIQPPTPPRPASSHPHRNTCIDRQPNMASANPRLGYHRPHPDSNPPTYFDGDDSAVLDPAILDADMLQSPKGAPFRKGSLANSNGVLSPADSHAWDQHYAAGLPVQAAAHPNPNAYHDDNGFVRPNAPHGGVQQGVYGHPPPGVAWTYEQAPSVCQPGASADFMAPPVSYEPMPYAQHRTDSAPASMPPPSMAPLPPAYHTGPGFMPAPQVQPPMSPHSHEDWMAMAQRETEGRPMSKRMRPNSPSSAMADYARRDGIRKKNGRIDIPQERNIHTIDELIDRTTDEDMLKELKQQKRLLRNREAA